RLLINCEPKTVRLHLTGSRFPNPPFPPPFCQSLRAHLLGAKIEAITQVPNDRIVTFTCASRHGRRTIVCELTGKHSDVLILNEEGHILNRLFHRRGLIGQPYTPPPKPQHGSPPTATDPICLSNEGDFPISSALDRYYAQVEEARSRQQAQEARLRVLKEAIKKERRRLDAWRDDLYRATKYRDYARYGELIKANLSTIKKGADHVTVIDYFDERLPSLTIPLNPTKSPSANMADYFAKYRKYLAAEQALRPRIEQAERNLTQYQEELAAIQQGTWPHPSSIQPGTHPASPLSLTHRPQPEKKRRRAFRRFISFDGLSIFVGRNAQENEQLTFSLAQGHDLWLHARGVRGSHVLVRLKKDADVPPETLCDAAMLALLYSDLKKSGQGEVIYTKRKWIRKATGRPPGSVHIEREQVLYVRLDQRRVERLRHHALVDEAAEDQRHASLTRQGKER
ncbi:MAG: NFACT family protein, partial [Nitrospira sp.]